MIPAIYVVLRDADRVGVRGARGDFWRVAKSLLARNAAPTAPLSTCVTGLSTFARADALEGNCAENCC